MSGESPVTGERAAADGHAATGKRAAADGHLATGERAAAGSREAHLVELVDEEGRTIGEATVATAHRQPGRLHRAFSVLLVDPDGRILLQQRAAAKTRFPLRWANACCGHPAPGQTVLDAANRRLGEELGIAALSLNELGVHRYRAEDPVTGRVEFEYDHVLRGEFRPGDPVRPDPTEVAGLRWTDLASLRAELVAEPQRYAPWLPGVIDLLDEAVGTGTTAHATPTAAHATPAAAHATPAADRTEWPGGR